jgi:arylsulfatase A-like enzyme
MLTPFIDSIQSHCIRFTKAHSTGPYTSASFPGILTSSYYLEHGRDANLAKEKVLISEFLKKSGIITAAFHSNPFISAHFGWNRGWDVFYDSMQDEVSPMMPFIRGEKINRKAEMWMSTYQGLGKDKPFFLWLHYMDVHEPYIPERRYLDLVDPTIHLTQEEMFGLFKNVVLKRDISDKGILETLRKLYCARVREVDDRVKELFGIMERLGFLKDSWVIIGTDHGDEFGEHGGLSHDGKMYSELVHVPLMIYDSDRKQEEVCDTLVSTLDIAPTIVHLFGVEPPGSFLGQSLLPTNQYQEKGVYGEAVDKHGSRERGDEKEVHYYREGNLKIIYREKDDAWELYDLAEDPLEQKNIIHTFPGAASLKNRLIPRVRRYQVEPKKAI